MPSGIYPRTEEHIKNMSLSSKGNPWTEARRRAQRSVVTKRKVFTSKYPPFWQTLRKEIYARDNWTCQECDVKCLGKNRKSKLVIQCHHIDYDTKNNNFNNLITLCANCHGKTRYNRQYWMDYYSKKVD